MGLVHNNTLRFKMRFHMASGGLSFQPVIVFITFISYIAKKWIVKVRVNIPSKLNTIWIFEAGQYLNN